MENKPSRIKTFFENLRGKFISDSADTYVSDEEFEKQFNENITYEDLLSYSGKPVKINAKIKGTILNIKCSDDVYDGTITVAMEGDFKRIVMLTYLDADLEKDFAIGNTIKILTYKIESTNYKSDSGEMIKVPLINALYIENL